MKKVLVIGGAGFIGSHIAEELVNKGGYEVTIFDNLSRGKYESIEELVKANKVKFIKGDITNFEEIDNSIREVEYVYHQAADNINKSQSFPINSVQLNMIGSVNIFESCLKNKIKKIIYASSASVYGNPSKLPMFETDTTNPITPYCITKLACENLLNFYSRKGLNFVALRYFNVYGERQNTDAYYTSVIILFLKRILSGEAPIIDGDGSQTMDFVNIKDIVQANILALQSDINNEIFNVATGTQTSIKELAEILIHSLDLKIIPQMNPRPVMVTKRQADITKIQKMLKYKVTVNRDEGLERVALDIKNNIDKY